MSELLERRVLLSAGDPDATFGQDGIVTAQDHLAGQAAFDAAVQSDGKVVVAGNQSRTSAQGPYETFVARYNADGTPDVSFGSAGRVALQVPAGYAASVVVQPDGKIVVGGRGAEGAESGFALARVNADGTPDTGFGGGDGAVVTPFRRGSESVAYDLAMAPGGKIVAFGSSQLTGDFMFHLARYNANGTLDTSFSGDGKVSTDLGPAADAEFGTAVAVLPDGSIVAVGGAGYAGVFYDFVVLRYRADGSPDPAFGTAGVVHTNFGAGPSGDYATDVAVQGDGKLVVAGESQNAAAVARYNADGSLDGSFGAGGKAVLPAAGGPVGGVALQSDGRILLAGATTAGSNMDRTDFVVSRLTARGATDPSFGGDGVVTTDFFGLRDGANAVALAPGGRVVAAGVAAQGLVTTDAIARYNGDGSLDATFGGDGTVTGATSGMQTDAAAVAAQPDGKVLVAGTATRPDGNSDFFVARYNRDGSRDATFSPGGADGDGIATADFGGRFDSAAALLVQDDGKIVVGGWSADSAAYDASGQFALARFNPDGSLDRTFSGDGSTRVDLGSDSRIRDLAAYPGGRILAAGAGGSARYNADGSLDTTFSSDGMLPVPASDGPVIAVDVDGDRIVLGRPLGIRRLNPDGSPDPTFAEVALPARETEDWPHFQFRDFEIMPDGDVLAGGAWYAAYSSDPNDLMAIRYNADGSPDQGFGGNGRFQLPSRMMTAVPGVLYAGIVGIEVLGDGRFVAAAGAYSSNELVLARFTPYGDVDPTFGDGGFYIPPGATIASPAAFATDRSGDLLTVWSTVGGYSVLKIDGGASRAGPISFDDGNVTVTGGAGPDTITVRGAGDNVEVTINSLKQSFPAASVGHVMVNSGGGNDTVSVAVPGVHALLDGGAGDDALTGSDASDSLYGGAGDDTLDGGLSADVLRGGDGVDLVTYARRTAPVSWGGEAGELDHIFQDVEQLRGGSGNDNLQGASILYGGPGDDTLSGGGELLGEDGNDTLIGGGTGTRYFGGAGNDTVRPTFAGGDRIHGDAGIDTLDCSGFPAVTVDLDGVADDGYASGGIPRDNNVFADVENIIGSPGNDTLTGSAADNRIDGGGGGDQIAGLAGNDTLLGGEGDDTLTDTQGTNVLDGGAGADTINGLPDGGPPTVPVYEAEDAQSFGPQVSRQHPGYTGSGYVDFQSLTQDWVSFTLQVPVTGTYLLSFRYANGSGADRPLDLMGAVQGAERLSFPPTGSWSKWSTVSREVQLGAGRQAVNVMAAGFSGPNLDSLTLTPRSLEAEDAISSGATVERSNGGFAGSGYVDYRNASGDYVEWAVDMPAGGQTVLQLRYANGSASDRPLALSINGAVVQPFVSFPRTGSWSTWRTVSVTVPLAPGINRVRLTATGASGPNIDTLLIGPAVPAPVTYEAEAATLSGPLPLSNVGGFTGTGFADYQRRSGDSVEFAAEVASPGQYVLEFRYANGGSSDRPLELKVNDAVARPNLSFAPTGSWSTWRTAAITVALRAGRNTIRLTSVGQNGPNLDSLTVTAV